MSPDSGYYEWDSNDTEYDGARRIVDAEAKHIAKWRGRRPRAGLALSGGGIRSASYCLGALQALAHAEVLHEFDYLSTVSGGGYIGASLSYLLSESANGPNRDRADETQRFDASRENFPYLSYPMVDAPQSEKPPEFERARGRLLRRLRQNAKYLAPGRGITVLSLVGVFLRNTLTSLAVYGALLYLALEILLGSKIVSRPSGDTFWIWSLGPTYEWPNLLLVVSGGTFALYLLLSLLYVVATGFFDPLEGWRIDAPYSLRRAYDVVTTWLLGVSIGAFIVGAVVPVYEFLRDLPDWKAVLSPDPAKRPAFFGAILTAVGLLGSFWGFLQTRSTKQPRIPTRWLVLAASAALLFGVLLLVFHIASVVPADDYWLAVYVSLGVLLGLGWLPDLNYVSLHRFYRDRLMELFLPDLSKVRESADAAAGGREELVGKSVPGDMTFLGKLCGVSAQGDGSDRDERPGLLRGPYHIINANVVLVASTVPRYRGRGGDNYILSPLFSGSRATGWKKTDVTALNGFTLATAMAISGAALNPNAGPGGEGVTRQPLLSVLMGIFNLRLGYWCENPGRPSALRDSRFASIFWKRNLLLPGLIETFGRMFLHERARSLLLTDGGHFENLGLYELVRRRLELIVVCDAGADPKFKFEDLANAIEKVRADFGAIIDLKSEDLEALVPKPRAPGATDETEMSVAQRGYLVAPIRYASRVTRARDADARAGREEPPMEGKLIYLKATFFKELYADLHGYRRAHPDFPDQTTGDQFFDEKQFEAYRELGFQSTRGMLLAESAAAEAEAGRRATQLLWILRQ